MANKFGLRPLLQENEGYYSRVQTPGIRQEPPASPMLAGRFGGFDLEEAKKYKDALGEIGPYAYMLDQKLRYENDPQRLRETIEVLGPYYKDVARESQRLGMEANLFAGFMDIPNKFSRAMAAQHYYMPETMQTIAGNIGRAKTPFVNRQYAQL